MATNVVGSGAGQIGRYFTVVSAVPASVFIVYVWLLASTDPWSGPLQWSKLAEFHPSNLVIAGVAALTLALALNPLQFVLIQFLEGYWGTSRAAISLALIRTNHHRRQRETLRKRAAKDPDAADDEMGRLRTRIEVAESFRALDSYPDHPASVLPTRLGNVLRRYENIVGRPYHINPLVAIPRLAMVAGDREVDYVRNQRMQLELATRTAVLSAVAALVTVLLMVSQGLWLLLALAPYAVTVLSYRGAVALAHEYGTSLGVLVDLGRFALYERVHLPHPPSTAHERVVNEDLMRIFRYTPGVSVSNAELPTPDCVKPPQRDDTPDSNKK